MESRNKYQLLILSLFITATSIAQFPAGPQERSSSFNFEANLAANNILRGRDVLKEVLNSKSINEIELSEVEGEQYFEKAFVKTNLIYKDSTVIGSYLMRYNAFADEIEISDSKGINILSKADYLSLTLNQDKYRPINYTNKDGAIQKGFFIEKVNGPSCSLFLRKYKTIKEGKEAKTSFHKESKPSFVDYETYYLKFENKSPFEIKLKKNKIIKAFPSRQDELKRYIQDQKLNIETEKGLIALVQYYNNMK